MQAEITVPTLPRVLDSTPAPLSGVGVYTGVVSALGVAGIAASLFNLPDDAVREE